MSVIAFDHAAIPTNDPEGLLAFYRALGFHIVGEDAWRSGAMPVFAIAFGDNKINVHDPKLWQNPRFTLRGPTAQPGCGDFCFVWDGDIESATDQIRQAGAEVIEGPVPREGGRALGSVQGTSVYTRDPDGNLIEFIVYGSRSPAS